MKKAYMTTTIAAVAGVAVVCSSCAYPNVGYSSYTVPGTVSAGVAWSNASYDASGFPIFGYSYGRPVYGYTSAGEAVFTIAALTALCFVPYWDRRAGTMDPTTTRAASTVCRLRRASLPVTHREYGRHMALFHRRHRAPPYRPTGSLDIRPFPRCPCPWAVAGGPCTRTLPCPVLAEQPFTRTARFTFQNPPESLPHPPRSCVRKQASLRRTTASPPCQCRFLRAAQA